MDQYRVFGNPISQSKSPYIHQSFAKQCGQAMEYKSELVALNMFNEAVEQLQSGVIHGANVTAPFKEQAYQLCEQISDKARLAGAVNTLTIKDGLLYGDTTDGVGLVSDLIRENIPLNGQKILLLGAGGAAKSVIQDILEQDPEQLTIANRTESKAQLIVEQYSSSIIGSISFDRLVDQSYDLIINATSAGLTGDSLPVPDEVIQSASACYDMVYGNELTPFLKKAESLGVKHVIDGLGMLVGQAAESFTIWRDVKPNIKPVLSALREGLRES